jgi:hypothetical protein
MNCCGKKVEMSIDAQPHSDRSSTHRTEENVVKIRGEIPEDRSIDMDEFAELCK